MRTGAGVAGAARRAKNTMRNYGDMPTFTTFKESSPTDYASFSPMILRNLVVEREPRQLEASGHDGQTQQNTGPDYSFNEPMTLPFEASILHLRVSGVSELTARLAENPAGAEKLADEFNTYLRLVFACVAKAGGDVLSFIGDVAIVIWGVHPRNDSSNTLEEATLRAACCGVELKTAFASYATYGDIKLKLSIGMATGGVEFQCLGGTRNRWEALLVGHPLTEITEAQMLSKPGQLVCTPGVWSLISHHVQGDPVTASAKEGFVAITNVRRELAPLKTPSLNINEHHIEAFSQFVPGVVVQNLYAGQGTHMAEMREVTALHIRLKLNPQTLTRNAFRSQQIIDIVQAGLYQYEGTLNKSGVDSEGIVFLGMFGLNGRGHINDATRAVKASLTIVKEIEEAGFGVTVGISTGTVFCGCVGSESRMIFTVQGDVENHCDTLSRNGRSGQVLCDTATMEESQLDMVFKQLPSLMVKSRKRGTSNDAVTAMDVFKAVRLRKPASTLGGTGSAGGSGRGSLVFDQDVPLVGREKERLELAAALDEYVKAADAPKEEGGDEHDINNTLVGILIVGDKYIGKTKFVQAHMAGLCAERGLEQICSMQESDLTSIYPQTPELDFMSFQPVFNQLFGLRPDMHPSHKVALHVAIIRVLEEGMAAAAAMVVPDVAAAMGAKPTPTTNARRQSASNTAQAKLDKDGAGGTGGGGLSKAGNSIVDIAPLLNDYIPLLDLPGRAQLSAAQPGLAFGNDTRQLRCKLVKPLLKILLAAWTQDRRICITVDDLNDESSLHSSSWSLFREVTLFPNILVCLVCRRLAQYTGVISDMKTGKFSGVVDTGKAQSAGRRDYNTCTIELAPLTLPECTEMLSELLDFPGIYDDEARAANPPPPAPANPLSSTHMPGAGRPAGVEEHLARTIATKSEGNPYYVKQFCSELCYKGWLQMEHGFVSLNAAYSTQHIDYPMSVKSSVYRDLDREPPQRQILLKVAAVLERVNGSFSCDEVIDVLPVKRDRGQVLFNVRNLVDRNVLKIIEPVMDPKRYAFCSPLMQAIAEPLMPLLINGPASKVKVKDEMIGVDHSGLKTLAAEQEPLSDAVIVDALNIFAKMDGGLISVKDFQKTLSRHGERPLTDSEVEDVFALLDTEESGLVHVDTLLNFLTGDTAFADDASPPQPPDSAAQM